MIFTYDRLDEDEMRVIAMTDQRPTNFKLRHYQALRFLDERRAMSASQ